MLCKLKIRILQVKFFLIHEFLRILTVLLNLGVQENEFKRVVKIWLNS